MRRSPHYRPTTAEREIVFLTVSEQLTPDKIAARRHVKADTVSKQLRKLLDATETETQLQLADWSYRHRRCCLGLEDLFERLLRDADSPRDG